VSTRPIAEQLHELVAADPERVVVRFVAGDGAEQCLTALELDAWSDRVAALLQAAGVVPGGRVLSELGNSLEHYVAAFATWKAGGCFVPLNPRSPEREIAELVALAEPAACVGDVVSDGRVFSRADLRAAPDVTEPPAPVVPDPGLALTSGGSTGRPKLVVTPGEWGELPLDFLSRTGFPSGQRQLVTGPVHHNGPFVMSYYGLLLGHSLVVMERFDADLALDLIDRHRIEAVFLVPTTMRRLLDAHRERPRDLSSLRAVLHSAAPCPAWLKQAWIDLIGAPHLFEGYGASEGVGGAVIRGDEWLARPGSVGRPYCELKILDEDGLPVPAGQVGEIWARRNEDGEPTYEYVGSPTARTTADCFVSVGDLGCLDDAGYLYIADRRVDLIISGGVNVYPAEVEAALSEHAEVVDVAVVGVPDEMWGARVHAVVQSRDAVTPPSPAELDQHCRARLAPYKLPKSYDFVTALPRSEAGKLRRRDIAEAAANR
jgi:bile acid-coenzyme A ligase